jgi:hypothetical protein
MSEGFTEASTFGRVLGTAAGFCEFLGYVGVVVDGIILIMRIVQEAQQYVASVPSYYIRTDRPIGKRS